jgi:cytochrome c-type biogenesis protein CcmH/NrfF
MRIMTLVLVIFMLTVSGAAQVYEFYNKKLTPEQKEQAIYLEKHIMATCCFGGPVYMHGKNQRSEAEKITIRRLLLEGKTTDQILDYFRNSLDPRTGKPYGNRILASPKASETVGKVSYWMVAGFSVIGLLLLVLAIRKLRRRQSGSDEPVELSEETLKKIESEISHYS